MCSPSFHYSRGSNFTLIRNRVQTSNPRWRLRWDRWFQGFANLPPIVNKETSLWKVSTISFRPVDIKSQSYREFMEHFFFVNAFSHVSLKITRTGAKKEKEKRGFPFDPCFLIGWCGLTVDSSKVLLHTRVLHRVILRATVRLWHNRLSRLRQTHNNVQSLFFNRVWHRCATGKWEFVCKNFVCWVAQTAYFN